MAKLTVPPSDFKTELAPGKLADAIKAVSAAKLGEMIRVPVGSIKVLDGFNVRVRETTDYKEGIAALQASIAANGFYADKPLAGYVAQVDGEPVIYLRDGHRRLEAVEAYNFEAPADAKIAALPVVVVAPNTTMEEHLVNLVQSNSGKDLTPFEKGLVVKRLVGFGMDKKAIAEKLGFTSRYIDDLLVIVGAPAAARTLILENKVSSTQALRELRKDPAKAAAALTAMVKAATDKGKAKASASDKGPKLKKIAVVVNFGEGDTMGAVLKALAAQVRANTPHAKDETDLLQTAGSLNLTIAIPAPEAEAKPAAAPKPAAKPKAETAAAKTAAAAKAAGLVTDKPKRTRKPAATAAAPVTETAQEAGAGTEAVQGEAGTPQEGQEGAAGTTDPLAHAIGGGEAPAAVADGLADL